MFLSADLVARTSVAASMRHIHAARAARLLSTPLRTLLELNTRKGHLHSSATANASVPAVAAQVKAMSGAQIREAFLSFFESKAHTRLPSSSLVPEDPTVLLTIAGMLQFKPVFLGQSKPKVPRATTTQKCVRTNDIENVGVTARHHTFFEMLGNFSFGDYFKKEAIQWSWELSTRVFQLPPERVWVSVYEEDDEALAIWRDVVGVPMERIRRMGAADNFWASGPTGPCGPCSELYYDFRPELPADGASLEDDSRFIEFYNLVFMQLNRGADGSLTPLAAQNIDTGLGLERMAQILQGVPNNYETDLIFPIVQRAATLAGINYHETDAATKTALKVIGDHTRAVTYLLSDGVTPSNVGRGYIVRRLLRRVIMKGRLLGIQEIFTPTVAAVAVALSGDCDSQVAANAQRIYDELAREEAAFATTLERGSKVLKDVISRAKSASDSAAGKTGMVSGRDAFLLYDTYGFPLELTQEMVEQQGLQVDQAGFDVEMECQRQRSKVSREGIDLTAGAALAALADTLGTSTRFTGYGQDQLVGQATVVALLEDGRQVDSVAEGSRCDVVLDSTPFYAESGGQVGDHGLLVAGSHDNGTSSSSTSTSSSSSGDTVLLVNDVRKAAGGRLFVHTAELQSGVLRVGQQVSARVDDTLRRRVRSHHTATHLLQAALKQVLGPDTAQQGSMVTFDRLRFDFNLSRPMTAAELSTVERLVNGWVVNATPLETNVMDLDAARKLGATAMFGEKYDDVVRVVNVPGVSMELCGGTHVSNTSEIGAFKVLSEAGIASGIRRIEAVSGAAAVEHLLSLDNIVRNLSGALKVKSDDIPARVAGLQSEVKAADKLIADLKAQLAVAQSKALVNDAVSAPKGGRVLVATLANVDPKAMQEAAAQLQAALGDPAAVVLGCADADGKASFVAAFSPQVVKSGLQAGKVVGAVAKVCGGGGGGKPNLAQAGGKDGSKVAQALELARTTLMEAL